MYLLHYVDEIGCCNEAVIHTYERFIPDHATSIVVDFKLDSRAP